MGRKSYERYDYIDPNNIYTYKDSSVLINKFNERDGHKASELEYRMVASQSLKLFANPIEVRGVDDILKIHRFLFKGIYYWAGEFRKVNISKSGNAFLPLQSFNTAIPYLDRLVDDFHRNSHNRDEIITGLVDILDNLNYFHPFREGNGRTQREVIRSLALMKGYECEISIGNDDEIYNLYMDGTVYGDKLKLTELFEKILVKL
ncbi:cell filamentation protein Fic [Granulicatella sp. zg-ZJ]|uniref:Fic/DOC family protein n=1 Tax=Granulicatella sp. zg-ZJ TaxID=2678504 RepID=UPI0013D7B755|nr:Fic family protein [Granulicatella sp. zg-ZJ]MBS4749604.1 Fic family protein [Carnobacteriaceae bacterium zg-ZUI78]NEW62423.1 cell filamentation protein Fic [Granulicatella sp. zg-ZJ]